MNTVNIPNLPDRKISLAAVGNYPEIITALHSLGIKTLSFENGSLHPEVYRHQDILMCRTGGNRIFLDPSLNGSVLEGEGFTVSTCAPLTRDYPGDVRLNVAVSRDYFIYNPASADPDLVAELRKSGKKGLETKQGYTKCSVCFVTENAVITEDESIYKALEGTGIDTLFISKGDVFLSDNHYGFFGGSTGKIDKNTLAVTGSLATHRDGEKIKDFCLTHGVKILELTKGRITDVGGILPLKA